MTIREVPRHQHLGAPHGAISLCAALTSGAVVECWARWWIEREAFIAELGRMVLHAAPVWRHRAGISSPTAPVPLR